MHTRIALATLRKIALFRKSMRRSSLRISRSIRLRSSPTVSNTTRSTTRARSITRPSRPAQTFRNAPIPASRKTGATASWLVCALTVMVSMPEQLYPSMPDRQVQPLSFEKERGRKNLFHFDRRGRIDAHALQIAANVARRLPDALFVFAHCVAHEAFAVFTIYDAGRERYAGMSQKMLGKSQ